MNLDIQRYTRRLCKEMTFAGIGFFALKSRSIHAEDMSQSMDVKTLEVLFRSVGDMMQMIMMRGIKLDRAKWVTSKHVIHCIHLPQVQSIVIIMMSDEKSLSLEATHKNCLAALEQLTTGINRS